MVVNNYSADVKNQSSFAPMNLRYAGLAIALIGFGLLFVFNRSKVELVSHVPFTCQKISSAGYECQSVLKFNNSNLLSATILSIHETYNINNKVVATINHDLQQAVPGKKVSSIPLAVRFAADDLPPEINGKTLLTVSGKIKYKSMFGEGEIPVAVSDTIIISGL